MRGNGYTYNLPHSAAVQAIRSKGQRDMQTRGWRRRREPAALFQECPLSSHRRVVLCAYFGRKTAIAIVSSQAFDLTRFRHHRRAYDDFTGLP